MKALLQSGEWAVIDTAYLFHDQYNTVDGKRIFDRDIIRMEDDARPGMGRCRYCGAMVKRGEEEKHFQEKEKRGCAGCFWCRDRVTDRKIQTAVEMKDGEKTTIKTTVEKLEKVCTYAESYPEAGCTLKECRRMGIDWFTPENTFFLKYPGGFQSIPAVDKLPGQGFIVDENTIDARYNKKIGSYTLLALLTYEDGKAAGIRAYRIYNCRRDYVFRFENGELFTDKYTMGWRKVKTLDGVPGSVMDAIRKICGRGVEND